MSENNGAHSSGNASGSSSGTEGSNHSAPPPPTEASSARWGRSVGATKLRVPSQEEVEIKRLEESLEDEQTRLRQRWSFVRTIEPWLSTQRKRKGTLKAIETALLKKHDTRVERLRVRYRSRMPVLQSLSRQYQEQLKLPDVRKQRLARCRIKQIGREVAYMRGQIKAAHAKRRSIVNSAYVEALHTNAGVTAGARTKIRWLREVTDVSDEIVRIKRELDIATELRKTKQQPKRARVVGPGEPSSSRHPTAYQSDSDSSHSRDRKRSTSPHQEDIPPGKRKRSD